MPGFDAICSQGGTAHFVIVKIPRMYSRDRFCRLPVRHPAYPVFFEAFLKFRRNNFTRPLAEQRPGYCYHNCIVKRSAFGSAFRERGRNGS